MPRSNRVSGVPVRVNMDNIPTGLIVRNAHRIVQNNRNMSMEEALILAILKHYHPRSMREDDLEAVFEHVKRVCVRVAEESEDSEEPVAAGDS